MAAFEEASSVIDWATGMFIKIASQAVYSTAIDLSFYALKVYK
jgi:hypothetical protein